ncbi:hypothetical protein DNTS_017898 [Danionella cerebrum]|uniref:Retinoic acid-induced protein 2 n=1 Tax=Danionella cerebrum TaxID=2873325 RepID=A0A553MSA4_9TELE|nr:hypothetical protein DNTS_017898 [Danionella translucida]
MEDSLAVNMTNPQEEICSGEETPADAVGKLEKKGTPIIPAETWSFSPPGITKQSLSPLITLQGTPALESPNSVSLKVATTVLQPICLGDSPIVLPVLASSSPQVGQSGAMSYLMSSQSPVSLPLVLDQQTFQHLNPQLPNCSALSLQNMLCQNPSLALGAPPILDQKVTNPEMDTTLLNLLQNPSFASILQDLFPGQGNPLPTCHPGPCPQIDLSSAFLPPLHNYSSPLAPLVPPATLLVPYPVVIPLPVPLPIPVPIPVPISVSKDSKLEDNSLKPTSTLSKSTQTSPGDVSPQWSLKSREVVVVQKSPPPCSSLELTDGEVLDLSMAPRRIPTQVEALLKTKQDNVLDLSLPSVRKTIPSSSTHGRMLPETNRVCHMGDGITSGALAIGVLRPVDCTAKIDAKLLSGLASVEFSRQHKWVVDSARGSTVAGSVVHDSSLTGGGNIEIVSTSQTAKVIVSVKDAMPAIFCSKLKGLSGVSTKNFSITRDASQGGFAGLPRAPGDQRGESREQIKKTSKHRGIKVKKVSSQEIHILPVKKQRLAALLPRK